MQKRDTAVYMMRAFAPLPVLLPSLLRGLWRTRFGAADVWAAEEKISSAPSRDLVSKGISCVACVGEGEGFA